MLPREVTEFGPSIIHSKVRRALVQNIETTASPGVSVARHSILGDCVFYTPTKLMLLQ